MLARLASGIVPVADVDYMLGIAAAHAFHVFVIAFAALPVVFAWLYRAVEGELLQKRRLLLTLSVALALWPAMLGGYGLNQYLFSDLFLHQNYLAAGLFVLATGVLWLFNIGVEVRLAKAARNAALVVFGVLAFGAFDAVILSSAFGYSFNAGGPFFGLARLATVVVLAHAILNQQVLGIDVKLRLAISKSTIAAVFIAVFFIASEAAQQFFGETLGSTYVGIAAAGALVFAMAPLQRAAERLAEKAVPITSNLPGQPSSRTRGNKVNEAIFRDATRLALRDRVLTRAEHATLLRLAESLQISVSRAVTLIDDAERKAGVAT
jgi:hypothetical protein